MEILFGLLIFAVVCFAGVYVVRGFRSGLQAGLQKGSGEPRGSDIEDTENSSETSN
jgi:hypothetical protein